MDGAAKAAIGGALKHARDQVIRPLPAGADVARQAPAPARPGPAGGPQTKMGPS